MATWYSEFGVDVQDNIEMAGFGEFVKTAIHARGLDVVTGTVREMVGHDAYFSF